MFNKLLIYHVIFLILSCSLGFYYMRKLPDVEISKCPFCFGEGFCDELLRGDVKLRMDHFADIINNLMGVKNVYFTNKDYILKKLGCTKDILQVDHKICQLHLQDPHCDISTLSTRELYFNYLEDAKKLLKAGSGYRLCGPDVIEKFVKACLKYISAVQLWTIISVNVEPLIPMVVESQYLPKVIGACGRYIVVKNAGEGLNAFKDASWTNRTIIAINILKAAMEFSRSHLYLTDISSDNIAVDRESLNVTFIDLDNFILVENVGEIKVHKSLNFETDDNEFHYSENEICDSTFSDHNIYSVCKLLLSAEAPWPMMSGGLLHSMPKNIHKNHPELVETLEQCVKSQEHRLEYAQNLLTLLQKLINNSKR